MLLGLITVVVTPEAALDCCSWTGWGGGSPCLAMFCLLRLARSGAAALLKRRLVNIS